MNREKRLKILVVAIILVLLIIVGILGFYLFTLFSRGTDVSEYRINGDSSSMSSSSSASDAGGSGSASNPIDFKTLRKINPEIFGWLYVPDTNIDYPLLQSNERDDFYLHNDIYRNYKYAGSLYTEYTNSTDLDDRVTVIYGHNMIDGSMFANLHKFRDKSFFDKHTKFYIYTPKRKLTYQVVSAYEYDDRHILNTFNFAENEVFKSYLKSIQNPHSISSNVNKKLDHKLTVKDKIVTMSTCLDSGDGRYLLQGVLVKDEPTR
ncbi:MAG: class B sortase [Ruminococcus sp.]|nr:class B sortase [Ruminococcus sp.]